MNRKIDIKTLGKRVVVKLRKNDKVLKNVFGLFKGVEIVAYKFISKSMENVYYAELIDIYGITREVMLPTEKLKEK